MRRLTDDEFTRVVNEEIQRMQLPERLAYKAQNDEMVDQWYTESGRLMVEAATRIEMLEQELIEMPGRDALRLWLLYRVPMWFRSRWPLAKYFWQPMDEIAVAREAKRLADMFIPDDEQAP